MSCWVFGGSLGLGAWGQEFSFSSRAPYDVYIIPETAKLFGPQVSPRQRHVSGGYRYGLGFIFLL